MNVHAAASLPLNLSTVHTPRSARSTVRADVQYVPDQTPPLAEREGEGTSVEGAGRHQKFERAHGVLRLLAAGHFKPVPEQRLRANFADLLGAQDNAPAPEGDVVEPDSAGRTDATPDAVRSADVTPDATQPWSMTAQPAAAEPSSIEYQHQIGVSDRPTIYVNYLA